VAARKGKMEIQPIAQDGTICIKPIGFIRSEIAEQQHGGFQKVESLIELKPEFSDYLIGIEEYSHLKVIYWLSEMTETHGLHRPQSNPDVPEVGMFACR
jgi:tRNA (Thr-GGU) A37 N-methylase